MLITGTQAEPVYRNLKQYLKVGSNVQCKPTFDLDDISGVVLFCPSSMDEFDDFAAKTVNSKFLPVVLTSLEIFDDNYSFPATYVQNSTFGLEFAGSFAVYNYIDKEMDDLYNVLHWARTGALMSFLVHNMNNVLTRIMGNTELATLFTDNPGKQAEKLEVAVEGAETLRDILSDLSKCSKVIEDDGEYWSTAYINSLLKMVEMSAGRTVELTVADFDMQKEFPVRRLKYDSMLGAVFAVTTLCISGNGNMVISLEEKNNCIGISVEWTSKKGDDEIAEGFYGKAIVLMHILAGLAPSAGTSFVIRDWDRTSGKALLTVPQTNSEFGKYE